MTANGYARVSTAKQDIERQVRNLLAYDPDMVIYQEQCPTRTNARLLARVRKSDSIVFDEVSRMSRKCRRGIRCV